MPFIQEILLATIRGIGGMLCLLCWIRLLIHQMGKTHGNVLLVKRSMIG